MFYACLSDCNPEIRLGVVCLGTPCALCLLRHSEAMTSGIFRPQTIQAISNTNPVEHWHFQTALVCLLSCLSFRESGYYSVEQQVVFNTGKRQRMWCCSPAVLPWVALIGEAACKPLFVPLQLHQVHPWEDAIFIPLAPGQDMPHT